MKKLTILMAATGLTLSVYANEPQKSSAAETPATEAHAAVHEALATHSAHAATGWETKGVKRGYRGFIDGTFLAGNDGVFKGFNVKGGGFSMSHGYQFSPHFFLGAGFAFYYHDFEKSIIKKSLPLFLDFRVDIRDHGISPFFDVRLGYSPTLNMDGLFFSPALGVRLGVTKHFALNFSLAYSMQQHYLKDFYEFSKEDEKKLAHCLNVSLGIEF